MLSPIGSLAPHLSWWRCWSFPISRWHYQVRDIWLIQSCTAFALTSGRNIILGCKNGIMVILLLYNFSIELPELNLFLSFCLLQKFQRRERYTNKVHAKWQRRVYIVEGGAFWEEEKGSLQVEFPKEAWFCLRVALKADKDSGNQCEYQNNSFDCTEKYHYLEGI